MSEVVLAAVDAAGSTDSDGATAARAPGRLYEFVDPDALNALFEPTASGERGDGRVTFRYAACEVTVRSDGIVRVRPSDERAVAND